ncbi:MAG: pilus assembly protein PilM [Verrucomicrobiota bacterium]
MALPFFHSRVGKQRDRMLAVDLGGRTTKAVHLQRRGQGFTLCGYALLDAPIFEKSLSAELLAEHLKAVAQALGAKSKAVTLTVGVNDSMVRLTEMPRLSLEDMRLVLKHSSRTYLQQELSNYVFDCHIVTGAALDQPVKPGESPKTAAGPQKRKVLVAGARKQLIDDFTEGARRAGLVADGIVPGLLGPVNAFEKTNPDVFANEAVAVVDLGYKSSSICILQQGDLILIRVVSIGGNRLTSGLAEALNVSYAEAEGIKIGMPSEVEAQIESLLLPLGCELRASLDFFEHQQDRPVTQVYLTGGSARSEFIVQMLQRELMIDCKILNPMSFLQLELPPQQAAEIERVAPQLTVALGAALAAF